MFQRTKLALIKTCKKKVTILTVLLTNVTFPFSVRPIPGYVMHAYSTPGFRSLTRYLVTPVSLRAGSERPVSSSHWPPPPGGRGRRSSLGRPGRFTRQAACRHQRRWPAQTEPYADRLVRTQPPSQDCHMTDTRPPEAPHSAQPVTPCQSSPGRMHGYKKTYLS